MSQMLCHPGAGEELSALTATLVSQACSCHQGMGAASVTAKGALVNLQACSALPMTPLPTLPSLLWPRAPAW